LIILLFNLWSAVSQGSGHYLSIKQRVAVLPIPFIPFCDCTPKTSCEIFFIYGRKTSPQCGSFCSESQHILFSPSFVVFCLDSISGLGTPQVIGFSALYLAVPYCVACNVPSPSFIIGAGPLVCRSSTILIWPFVFFNLPLTLPRLFMRSDFDGPPQSLATLFH